MPDLELALLRLDQIEARLAGRHRRGARDPELAAMLSSLRDELEAQEPESVLVVTASWRTCTMCGNSWDWLPRDKCPANPGTEKVKGNENRVPA
jgi:hypothetical protein